MRWFQGDRKGVEAGWKAEYSEFGIQYVRSDAPGVIPRFVMEAMLIQWVDEGLAIESDGGYTLSWDSVYGLLGDLSLQDQANECGVPSIANTAPYLVSRGALTDVDFEVTIDRWTGLDDARIQGALIKSPDHIQLLPPASWELVKRVVAFAQRTDRTERYQRIAWGEIRRLALAAGAHLDDFLYRTVVLSPDRLKIGLRQSDATGSRVIEVIPDFDGSPPGWLIAFDRHGHVPDRYDLATPEGVVQIMVSANVRTVLEQIRQMPGRRVFGARAEAFITNPFAALGTAAHDVIDADDFERERERIGVVLDRFSAYVNWDTHGVPIEYGLVIETGTRSISRSLTDGDVKDFAATVRAALAEGRQLCSWKDYKFELLGTALDEIKTLEGAVEKSRNHQQERASSGPSAHQVYSLALYSQRIASIGIEGPYASPYIARKNEKGGWFPENLVNIVELSPAEPGEPARHIPLTPREVEKLQDRVREAKAAGATSFSIPGVKGEIPVNEIEVALSCFAEARADAEKGDLEKRLQRESKPERRKGLVIKPNVVTVDYWEHRRDALLAESVAKELPTALKPNVILKAHQCIGVQWLQHLFSCSPEYCRGAVLADDMGLGKTLQLLILIAWAHERDPHLEPALVVAPVALLENWREEARKFLTSEALPLIEMHGQALADMRVPWHEVDEQLRKDGLVKFLKAGWIGDAKLVLTTYEALRDLEFSFAAEKWSILVCDEAQKVKNPNALITRAVKKQNARFRIACTGTPVENCLTDLWCLFDFVQPGLLGALNSFGQRYRQPIEASTEDEKQRVQELRELIRPQILRRMKSDVIADLPQKIDNKVCKSLKMTAAQRVLYAQAVEQYGRRGEHGARMPLQHAFGLLRYLRLVCTDPQPFGLTTLSIEPLAKYRARAAKLDWLLKVLEQIRALNEKALIFCEFKNVQRLLHTYIEKELGYKADIINGDTAASSKSEQSRHKRIQAFQARPGFGVLILSPLAVGFGVNIQAANHVIHYSRCWNPAKEDQATDRAYRIGQEKDVHVYCPMVVAEDFKSFDVKLDELLSFKRQLAGDMLNGNSEIRVTEFDIEDLAPPGTTDLQPRVLEFADVVGLEPRLFEAYIALLWTRQGYSHVTLTPSSGDDGIDVVAVKNQEADLIQCKSSRTTDRELSWEAIKDVVTGEASYRARYGDLRYRKVCVTTQWFNPGAQRHAELNSVQLIDKRSLQELHGRFCITLDDVYAVLFPAMGEQR
jgi:SNF2-related domain/Restriction endonuclease/Helicase conserved C-terminal domain